MPTYEYACESCGCEFEEFQSITAKPLKKCPQCGKMRLHRLIGTGGGVIFRGSGFYQTDYRSESYKKAAAAETSARSDSAGDGNSKKTDGRQEKPAKGKPASKSAAKSPEKQEAG